MMMITSSGKQPEEMTLKELQEEKRIQRWFASQLSQLQYKIEYHYDKAKKNLEENDPIERIEKAYKNGEITQKEREHKKKIAQRTYKSVQSKYLNLMFLRHYELAVRTFIKEIEDAMEYHKPRPTAYRFVTKRTPYRKDSHRHVHYITKEDIRVAKKKQILHKYETLIDRNGMVFQWDKRKLMLIAKDRGYMTEIAVAYTIEEELGMPKRAVKKMLQTGKMTWGQVLVIGALFEMTPKEFCDTFLLGYFIEIGGDWRASFKNIDKDGLLAKPVIGKKRDKSGDGTTTE